MSELAATQDKPEARGFKLARKVGANATRGVSPSVAARTRVSAGGAPVRVPFVSNPGRNRTISATAPRAGVGRADLRVTFVTGSAELTEAGRREAEKFMSALNAPALAGKRFRIEGHTDSVGSRQANVDLSERRARAVVLHLTAKGADPSRFEVVGFGSDKPIVGFDASASANRRVEIVLVK